MNSKKYISSFFIVILCNNTIMIASQDISLVLVRRAKNFASTAVTKFATTASSTTTAIMNYELFNKG